MTTEDTTDQTLREQIAQAIHRASCSCEGHGELPSWYRRAADAVLPIVQAHTEALQDKLAHALVHWNDLLEATDSMMAERDAALSDLSSLRSAVAQLAAEYQARADADPWDDTSVEIVAERLRSLLPQEGPK